MLFNTLPDLLLLFFIQSSISCSNSETLVEPKLHSGDLHQKLNADYSDTLWIFIKLFLSNHFTGIKMPWKQFECTAVCKWLITNYDLQAFIISCLNPFVFKFFYMILQLYFSSTIACGHSGFHLYLQKLNVSFLLKCKWYSWFHRAHSSKLAKLEENGKVKYTTSLSLLLIQICFSFSCFKLNCCMIIGPRHTSH